MSQLPTWLPKLILLEDYGGHWQRYEDEVYAKFYTDFIESKPRLNGVPVYTTRQIIKGKERGFWHCIQEGRIEDQRVPDLRRCERIGWVRAIVEHANDPCVKKWINKRGRKARACLWFEQVDYLVVLERRKSGWLLWTAYCTTWEHTRRRLSKEYEASLKKPTPPL